MTEKSSASLRLMHALYQSGDVEEVRRYLDEAEALVRTGELTAIEAFDLQSTAFRALQELTLDDAQKGEGFIAQLADVCLTDAEEPEKQYTLRRCRKQLREWLDQYGDTGRIPLRNRVLDLLLPHLSADNPEPACYTISTIGYRRDDIVAALWSVEQKWPDERGDVAMSTLVALGIPVGARPDLLRALQQRVIERTWPSIPLVATMASLPDPSNIPIIATILEQPIDPKQDESENIFLVQILIEISQEADADQEVADDVWQIITVLIEDHPDLDFRTLYINSKVASGCDSDRVVPTLVARIAHDERLERSTSYSRWLLCQRMAECVRPRQLEGWTRALNPEAIAALSRDARCDTVSLDESERHTAAWLKEAAWHSILCAGERTALDWLDEAAIREQDFNVRGHVCDILACFHLAELPSGILSWLTEDYNLVGNERANELPFRNGAVDLARSSASKRAFEALAMTGFALDGQASRQLVDALTEVALLHAHGGDTSVVRTLVKLLDKRVKRHQRVGAATALAALSAHGLVPSFHANAIAMNLANADRDDYERGMLALILDRLTKGDLSPQLQDQFLQWAENDEDWLGWRSLEVLARRDILPLAPTVMQRRLALVYRSGTWHADPGMTATGWAGSIIGALYWRNQDRFASTVADTIRTQPWDQVVQVVDVLLSVHGSEGAPPLTAPIADALLNRLWTTQGTTSSETTLFKDCGRLLGDRLAEQEWETQWAAWLADARGALAEALGSVTYKTDRGHQRAVALLLALTQDALYAVRRLAYRSLAHLAPDALLPLCRGWADAPIVALRQRAAEAAVWIEAHAEFAQTLLDQLRGDVEPLVREAMVRARSERRERFWAERYLAHVSAVSGANEEIIAAWPYGQALTQLGDDETLRALRRRLSEEPPYHLRFWLQRIVDGVEKRWRDVTKTWPEPWIPLEGKLDVGDGYVETSSGERLPVQYTLWAQPARNIDAEVDRWGGSLYPLPMRHWQGLILHLFNGRWARITITEATNESALFVGSDPCPI